MEFGDRSARAIQHANTETHSMRHEADDGAGVARTTTFLSMMCRCFALSLFIHHTGTQSRHDAHYNIMHNHWYTVDAWIETAKNTVIIWMQILSVWKWNFRQH